MTEQLWRKTSAGHGQWITQALFDWSCLMVGVNWATSSRTGGLTGFYIHVGPVILGVYRWDS